MRRLLRSFKHGFLFGMVLAIAPRLYRAYLGFVFRTSRVTTIGFEESVWGPLRAGENLLGALPHQDAILAPYMYRDRDFLVLISRSRDGEIISEIMKRLGYRVVRGSSSRGGARASREIVGQYRDGRGILTAITVDGPRGPAFHMKRGIIHMARESGSRVMLQRGWAKHKWLLPSWDRTMIPLPFNHLLFLADGPHEVPFESAPEDLDRIRDDLERRLRLLAIRSQRIFPGSGWITSGRRRFLRDRMGPQTD